MTAARSTPRNLTKRERFATRSRRGETRRAVAERVCYLCGGRIAVGEFMLIAEVEMFRPRTMQDEFSERHMRQRVCARCVFPG